MNECDVRLCYTTERCRKPTASDQSQCEKHAAMKCAGCGGKITHFCEYDGLLVCGAPLCDQCTGATAKVDRGPGLGWGFKNHIHVHKSAELAD